MTTCTGNLPSDLPRPRKTNIFFEDGQGVALGFLRYTAADLSKLDMEQREQLRQMTIQAQGTDKLKSESLTGLPEVDYDGEYDLIPTVPNSLVEKKVDK